MGLFRGKMNKLSDEISVQGKTDVGKMRSNNEDYFEILVGNDAPEFVDAVIVVADGMGGHAAGEVASGMSVKGVMNAIGRFTGREAEGKVYSGLLGEILVGVNRDVYLEGKKPEFNGMGTTCTAAVIAEGQLHVAHVGDSRCYVSRNGNLTQVTRDHGWVAEQVEAGNLTLEQASVHPYRNVVTRAIGTDEEVLVDTFVEDLSPGDRVLICSDGLHSVVGDEDIEKILNSGPAMFVCDELIQASNARGGPDNITVVIADI